MVDLIHIECKFAGKMSFFQFEMKGDFGEPGFPGLG
jgi:hypothetical protein